MDKNTILSIAPHVLKRMEYSIDTFYLLNFENDEIWTGNYSSYLIIKELNGKDNIDTLIKKLAKEYDEFSYEDLYNSSMPIFQELADKKFIYPINNNK